MRILVAGAAGFLGSHLIESLLNEGHHVIGLDNLSTGRFENVEPFINSSNFQFINHDVTEPISLEIDAIYNLACPASPPQYQKNPVQTIRTSVLGSMNLLDLALRTGATILQASTSEIYGDPQNDVQEESYWGNVNPIGIRSCYDEGKRAAETLFFDYHRQHNVKIKVVRIFNTYGPQMDLGDGRVVSNFIVQALKGEDLTLYGDGLQTRSFCYVDDLIRGLKLMMATGADITGPVNLGNPETFTILELAHQILNLTGSSSKLVFEELPSDDPKQRKPDISLARKLLNWNPTIALENGINRSIPYFQSKIEETRDSV